MKIYRFILFVAVAATACTAEVGVPESQRMPLSQGDSAEPEGPSPTNTNAANTALCGNGEVEAGEACDSGAQNGDGWSVVQRCNSTCDGFSPYCGDGLVQNEFESCDDGAANGNDWQLIARCNAQCTGQAPHCGDGELDADNEACDDGATNTDAWTATEVCNGSCTGPSAYCGDGTPDAGFEACDDGNDDDADSCSNSCVLSSCGNGEVDSGEDCDSGGVNTALCDANCSDVECGDGFVNDVAGESCDGAGEETASCDLDCTEVTCGDTTVNAAAGESCDTGGVNTAACDSDCTAPECGDRIVNAAANEACDDGGVFTAECNDNCSEALCGDGIVNTAAGEECDGDSGCDSNCIIVGCGDGEFDAGEVCDDGNRINERPFPVTEETADYTGSACTRDCTFDASLCHNGTLDPGEECDLAEDPADSMGACTRSCQVNDYSFGAACTTDASIDGPSYSEGNISGCDNIPVDFDSDCELGCIASVNTPAGPVYWPGGYCSLYAMGCEGSPFVCSTVSNVGNPDLCDCPPGLFRLPQDTVIENPVGDGILATIKTVICAAPCTTDADCRTREWDDRWEEWGQYRCTQTDSGNSFCFDPRNQVFVP